MNDATEVVLNLWRRGVRIERAPGGRKVRLWPACRVTPELVQAVQRVKRVLLRRLGRPPGWPPWLALPPWWPELAPGFHIVRARAETCPRCGYPAMVQWLSPAGPRWNCPQCGCPAESHATTVRAADDCPCDELRLDYGPNEHKAPVDR